jgi:hypothetical protein
MSSPAEIPNNLYMTGSERFSLSDEDSVTYERLRDENRKCAFQYQVGCYIYGIIFASLAIPLLFFNYTRKYAIVYIGLCIIWTIWYRNYTWNKWTQVTNNMTHFVANNKY